MGRLNNKVVVVTGAAEGIGRAIAAAMAREAARVIISDINDAQGNALVTELHSAGLQAEFVHCDVSVHTEVAALMAEAVKWGGHIDVLVNNAAVAIGGMPVHEMTEAQWQRLIAVNLSSVFYACKHCLPHMLAQGSGSIINLASAQAHVGLDGWTAYAGAKGAILSMTRQMAVEYGPKHIRVNSISPGTIDTPMNQRLVEQTGPELMRAWVGMHPLGRIGYAEEVAQAAVYLASDAAGFTTGTDLRVDGGLSAAPRYFP